MADRKTYILLPALALSALFLLIQLSGAASSSVPLTATTTVINTATCNFGTYLYNNPVYPLTGNIVLSYGVRTFFSCAIPHLNGTATLKDQNSNTVFQQSLNLSNTGNTLFTGNFQIASNTISNLSYTLAVNFHDENYSNTTSSTIRLLSLANVIITNFTASNNVVQGDQVQFVTTLLNAGQLASNGISLNLNITGPQNFSTTLSASALSPGQSETLVNDFSNLSSTIGTYSANVSAYYGANTISKVILSNTINYTILAPVPHPGGGGGNQPNPVPNVNESLAHIGVEIPNISITSAPLLLGSVQGSTQQSYLGFSNTGTNPEVLLLNIPFSFSNLLKLSADNVTLNPGQSIIIGAIFNSSGVSPGTYIIPVTITTYAINVQSSFMPPAYLDPYLVQKQLSFANGAKNVQIEYLKFVVYANTTLPIQFINKLSLLNSTTLAQGTVQITNNLLNLTSGTIAETIIPLPVAISLSQISAYGIPHNITEQNGQYVILWNIGALPKSSTVYGYYSITQPNNQALLQKIQNNLLSVSNTKKVQILTPLNISVPQLYTNSSGNITAYALYTGSSPQNVSFSLSGAFLGGPNASLIRTLAQPNQLLKQSFTILGGSTPGTKLLTLLINTNGANYTYPISLLVLAKPLPPVSQAVSQKTLADLQTTYAIYGIVSLIVIIAAILTIRRGVARFRRPRYSKERTEDLIKIRERMNRLDEE